MPNEPYPEEVTAHLTELLSTSMTAAVDYGLYSGNWALQEEFFRNVYVDVGSLQHLASVISSGRDIVVVSGPAGSGKTTTIYRALHEALTESGGYFIMDLKVEAASFYVLAEIPADEMFQPIQCSLINALRRHFIGSDTIALAKFIYEVLLICFPSRIADRVLRWASANGRQVRELSEEDTKELITATPETIREEAEYVFSHLTLAAAITAIKAMKGYDSFVLVVDNVDRLSLYLQPYLMSVLLDAHNEGRGAYATIVAVREKNLVRYQESGADDTVVRIMSSVSKAPQDVIPLQMPKASQPSAKAVINKRLDWLYRLGSENDLRFQERDQAWFDLFHSASSVFIKQEMYELSNHNYRNMLVLYVNFVTYLTRSWLTGELTYPEDRPATAESELRTRLYRWIAETESGAILPNVVLPYLEYTRGRIRYPYQAFLHLLILSWLSARSLSRPRISALLEATDHLLLPESEVLDSLYSLYDDVAIRGRTVEIGNSERPVLREDLGATTQLQITPLGNAFICSTITKFQFLFQYVLRTYDHVQVSREEQSAHDPTKLSLDFLRIVAKTHADWLSEFLKASSQSSQDAREYFLSEFCVENRFLIERIVKSHLAYFRHSNPKGFEQIHLEYKEVLDEFYAMAGLGDRPDL